jgi:alpha-1,2-mannosyltransferase
MRERLGRMLTGERLFVAAMLLIFVGVSIQYSFKAAHGKSAIIRWTDQILQIDSDVDIHRQFNYPNPPIMAILLWPISELVRFNVIVGALTWFYLKIGMAMFCVVWVFRLVQSEERPFPPWAKLLTIALSFRPILADLTHGNVNIFILFLIVASLAAFARGRDFLAGALLALAIACKVTPALFIAYFAWKQAWRVLAGCSVGLLAFFFFVPAVFIGWDHNLHALTSWVEVMIVPFVVGGYVTPEHVNQSLPGLVTRLFTSAPSFSAYVGGQYVPLRYDNVVNIGPRAASAVVKAFMGLFSLLVIWSCRAPIAAAGKTAAQARQGWRLAAEYSLICIGMLIFSERTWKHHCVTLLLPFAVISYGLASVEWSTGRKRFMAASAAVATLVMLATSTGLYNENLNRTSSQAEATAMVLGPAGLVSSTQSGIYTDSPAKLAQVYGAFFWGFCLLIAALMVQMRQPALTTAQAAPAKPARPLAA